LQGLTENDLIDFTPELHRMAVDALKNSHLRYGAMYTPGSLSDAADGTKGTVIFPGAGGGANWWGGVADPETGFVYMSSSTNPTVIGLRPNTNPQPNANPNLPPFAYVNQGGAQFPTLQGGLRIFKPPYGRLTAYDMNKGVIAWQIANGDTPANVKNNPLLQGLTIPKTGSPRQVGLMTTKTLLFAGDGTDPMLNAYDKKTGELVAQLPMPGMQTGLPMTYMHDGRQFILVAVGSANGQGPQLIAFAQPAQGGAGGGRGGRGGRGAAGAAAPEAGAPPADGAAPAAPAGGGRGGRGGRGQRQ
jgi:quinoprotein glucose dehydrogenase